MMILLHHANGEAWQWLSTMKLMPGQSQSICCFIMVNYDCRFILVTADMELRSTVYCIQHIADYIALEDITSLCGLFGLMAKIKRY